MNTAILVLRLVPSVLFIGHGLQKLVPARYSPPLLHAAGLGATAGAFEALGLRPGVLAALLAAVAEILGGFSLAAGLLTPIGTLLIAALMTTAILTVHLGNGLWNAEGGLEYNLALVTMGFVVTALGPGVYSIDSWAHIGNWAGVHWAMGDVARSAIVLAIGAAAGVLPVAAAWMARQRGRADTGAPSPAR